MTYTLSPDRTGLSTVKGDLSLSDPSLLKRENSKAYLSGRGLKERYWTAPERKPLSPMAPKVSQPRTGPLHNLDVCFYDFTEVFEKRIYPVLNRASGVTDIRRVNELCDGKSGCLCYELLYNSTLEELSTWLRKNLNISKVLPFRLVPKSNNRLEVHFDGGFE